jgi:hypothetical protein
MRDLEQLKEEKKSINQQIKEAKRQRRQEEGTWVSRVLTSIRHAIYMRVKPQPVSETEAAVVVEEKLNGTLDKLEGMLDKAIEEQKCSQPVSP